MLVYSIGRGVHAFTLDPSLGEFILSHENLKIPPSGKLYSVNEGNFGQWEPATQACIQYFREVGGYSSRYSGALVADLHRILFQGGVFLYPGTRQKPQGKLRLLYEAAPLAFLIEQAGGQASDGQKPIMDLIPDRLHARSPLIIGSPEEVNRVESLLQRGSG